VHLDATCVSQPVDRYEWVLDTTNEFDRVTVSNGPAVLDYTWDDDDCEDGETITFRLTVYRGAASSSATKSTYVPGEDDLKALSAERLLPLSVAVQFDGASSGVRQRAQIGLDGVAVPPVVPSGERAELRVNAAAGRREIAALVMGGRGEPGLLRIDLNGTIAVVAGSLRATEGAVMAQGPRTIVFRLDGRPGEVVRFTFELR
jgi:hypothetical protein